MKKIIGMMVLIGSLSSSYTFAGSTRGTFQAAPAPQEGYSLVYMYRIKVPPGLRTPDVLVDGEKVLKLPNNSYSWFYVTPGSHVIKTSWGFMAEVPDLETVVTIAPNQTYYLKMEGSVRSWGMGQTKVYTGIKDVDEVEAMKDLAKSKKYSAAIKTTVGALSDDEEVDGDVGVENVAFAPAAPPADGYALVYLYRPDAPPAMRRAGILIDGREVMKVPNKAYSWFYIRDGQYTIQTKWGKIYNGVEKVNKSFQFGSGETYYLRLSGTKVPKGTYDFHTSRLDQVTGVLAKKELEKIKRYSAADIQTVQ